MSTPTIEQLQQENQRLRDLLAEAEDTLRALRAGEVDAVLVARDREQVFTLDPADKPYRLMVDQTPQAAATFTTDGVIVHGNLHFERLLGRSLDELVGKPIYDFLAGESRAEFEAMVPDVHAAEVQIEVTLRRADGALLPVYLGISALREGALGTCLVVTDLTEQKHYAELRQAQDALREADRRKNEFVAILAHELRNPLGPIRNAARILKLKGPQLPDLKSPIDMIERQTEQLARLLDDLLDVSRITRGALEIRPERSAISTVVDASLEASHEELHDRGIRLLLHMPAQPVELLADRARLIQLLCNLLSNAAKYTPTGGQIELTVAARGGTMTLSVKDNGIGIPSDKLTEIFELFAQVERPGGRAGGLGIGLTLVRQIAILHGGSIEARSAGIGHGSEFILTLPVVAASAAGPVALAAPGPAAAPRRILVVDDNRDAAESLTVLLQIAGHEVEFVLDGEAAIELAEQTRPEVVFLDLGMPIVNGYEVARRIRALPWGKRTHLVALSGWGQADERMRTKAAGFHSHLVKPVAPEAISRLLESLSAQPGDTVST